MWCGVRGRARGSGVGVGCHADSMDGVLVTHACAAVSVRGWFRIVGLVIDRGWARARVVQRFRVGWGAVSKVLDRYRAPLLGHIDKTIGTRLRTPGALLGPAAGDRCHSSMGVPITCITPPRGSPCNE